MGTVYIMRGMACTNTFNPRYLLLAATLIAVLILVAVCGFYLKNVVLLFSISALLAYVLNPLFKLLNRACCNIRWLAALLLISALCITVLSALVFLMPILAEQFLHLTQMIPEHAPAITQSIRDAFPPPFNVEVASKISDIINGSLSFIIRNLKDFASNTATIISMTMLSPLVIYYMLKDGQQIVEGVINLVPSRHHEQMRKVIAIADNILSAYFRGQTRVCFMLALFYSITLSIVGLNSAILIGCATGLLSYIPYVGLAFGFISSTIVAALQFMDVKMVLLVVAIVACGQLLETAFLTPNLVGSSISLHPLLVIGSILCGYQFFGFMGLILIIPLVAVIKTLFQEYWGKQWNTQSS